MKFLEPLFRSRVWKFTSFLVVVILAVLVGHSIVTARYALQLLAHITHKQQIPTVAGLIADAYTYGISAAALLTIIILAGLIDLLREHYTAARFRSIARIITRFAAGEHSLRVPSSGSSRGELVAVSRAFNNMADTLVANMQALQQKDILRRKLVANIAHDLGTPLTSIKGYLERILLKGSALSPEQRDSLLNTALNNATVLSKLVGDLVELSRFDAVQLKPVLETFSILTLAEDVASRLSAIAHERKITIDLRKSPGLRLVRADMGLIERVLSNIIDNAIRYTPDGGSIQISFDSDTQRVTTIIRDTGIGIAKAEIPHVFERFYRADVERAKSTGGLGLGLAIAKEILDAHKSKIEIESELGQGTAVKFDLEAVAADVATTRK